MGSNTFGNLFKIMTWGESHGKAVGVVIDGCPAGLSITEEEIAAELAKRRPGLTKYTSQRKESDIPQLLSGVFEGKTTGAPISILIPNCDIDSSKYEPIKDLLRPGHANFTYLKKYGIFDYRGGGRASARETVCRVAAGAVAKKLLRHLKIEVVAYLKQVQEISVDEIAYDTIEELRARISGSPVFCPDEKIGGKIIERIEQMKSEGDSLGGVVELITSRLPMGLGDPVYEKLEAQLAKAMLSLPASKGFEIGSGFQSTRMKGSENNDEFTLRDNDVTMKTNHAGGTLGGISSGMPLRVRVAFKPTSSIAKLQSTLNLQNEQKELTLPPGSRHDPCVAIRAVPIVEAMGALVLADTSLMCLCSRLSS